MWPEMAVDREPGDDLTNYLRIFCLLTRGSHVRIVPGPTILLELSSTNMDKDLIITKLREHAPELREAGLIHLRVFGSVARGDANANSDVDLLADFDKSKRVTLVTMGNLESRLADL